jgi:hypothetical protein
MICPLDILLVRDIEQYKDDHMIHVVFHKFEYIDQKYLLNNPLNDKYAYNDDPHN